MKGWNAPLLPPGDSGHGMGAPADWAGQGIQKMKKAVSAKFSISHLVTGTHNHTGWRTRETLGKSQRLKAGPVTAIHYCCSIQQRAPFWLLESQECPS